MYEIKIGSVIKRLLRKAHKNLKEISRETDIPYSTLHTWQENRQPKDILKAQKLADHFGITLHELLFDTQGAREKAQTAEIPKVLGDEFFKGKFEIVVRRIE